MQLKGLQNTTFFRYYFLFNVLFVLIRKAKVVVPFLFHLLTLITHCYHIYLVVRDEAGLEANEDDGPLLVPGHVEPVQVGVGTQPPQLEIHLVGVLAGAHDGHSLL